jgi:hypothetical protein
MWQERKGIYRNVWDRKTKGKVRMEKDKDRME